MAESGRWADTQEGRDRMRVLREAVERLKSDGIDVGELDEYLRSPDITREEIELLLRDVNGRIYELGKAELEQRTPPECPKCFAEISPTDKRCPSCFAQLQRLKTPAAVADRRPERESRVEPEDRKCPGCGRWAKPYWRTCPSCGFGISTAKPPAAAPKSPSSAPAPDRCPECKSHLRPDDRKCPTCGHRFKPWLSV